MPVASPVTSPVAFTLAVLPLLLDHVPPGVGQERLVVPAIHTLSVPAIGLVNVAPTVTGTIRVQPVVGAYIVTVADPAPFANTFPIPVLTIFTTLVSELIYPNGRGGGPSIGVGPKDGLKIMKVLSIPKP